MGIFENMILCPICNSVTYFLTQKRDRFGQEYNYVKCQTCQFLFEQDLVLDPVKLNQRVGKLYGGDYFSKVDEGWQQRGDGFLKIIKNILKIYRLFKRKKVVSVLDYGAGNGYLASKLSNYGNIFYYDTYEKPEFFGNYKILEKPEKSDIMYAVELVEHLTNIKEWDFLQQVSPDIFIFTTCLSDNISDKEIHKWIYLNPDAGHVALHSTKSLYLLAKKYGFLYLFFPNISCHIFIKNKFLSRFNFVLLEYFIYNLIRGIVKK